MAATGDTPPRFFKVFYAQFSSVSMMIPFSYYDELPRRLPKTAILHGTGGCSWNVAMKWKRDELHFGQGWSQFVKDNSLRDRDFLTFDYDGDRAFEVTIYGPDGCNEDRVVDDEEDSVQSLTSDNTDTSSEANTDKNKRKARVETVEVSDDDEEEDSVYSLSSDDTDKDTSSDFEIVKTIQKSGNKGKKKVNVVEDSDQDYDSDESSGCSRAVTIRERVKSKIKNPETYLDNPKNVFFETGLKIRTNELSVPGQVIKDYCLKFRPYIYYIDNHKEGKLKGKTTRWSNNRVCFKEWNHVCERNNLKKEDRILCELFRRRDLVHAIKIHIVRDKDL